MGRGICDSEINPRKQRIILTGEKDMTQEEKLKHFQVWLEEVEQDFNNEEDEESARIIAGVKSMFEAIFDL